MKSSMGQCLDMLVANSFKLTKFKNFTMENYAAIVKYKTAYYSFVLPVCLAMSVVRIQFLIAFIITSKFIHFADQCG